MTTLEKSEQEARRIEGALARIDGSQVIPRTRPQGAEHASQGSQSGSQTGQYGQSSPSDFGPASPPRHGAEEMPSSPEQERDEEEVTTSPKKTKKRLSVGKVFGFGKLNYAMKGIIDVDPETTRRNNIGKTKESINQV